MGGSYDALMLRQQPPPQAPGRYSGTAVPHVSGPSPRSYTQPQNWGSPAVSGRDLIVRRDVLRQVARDLAGMADQMQATLSAFTQVAGAAAGVAGSWHEARQLARAISRAHAGVTQFTGELRQAHHDMSIRLCVSADRYDAAEQQITSRIHAATDPSATIVGSGGQDTPVEPGYGQNWSPAQRAAYYRMQRLENIPGNGGPTWTGTFPITEDAGFSQGGTAGYTWQQVSSLLAATSPGGISAAGSAYGQLATTLTEIASRLSGHGQALATNWGGSTAVTAVSQVQQLYQTAADMQANTWAAQQALEWYGSVLSTFTGSVPQPVSSHPADVAAADQAAQQRMSALNSHIETAYYQMPAAVNENLPTPLATTGGGGTGTTSSGSGYRTGGSTGISAGAVTPAGAGGVTGTGTTAPHLASLPQAGTTTLAGFSPPASAVPAPELPGAAGAVGTQAGAGGMGVLSPLAGAVPGAGFGPAPGRAAAAAEEPAGEFGPGGEPAPAEFGAAVPRPGVRDLVLGEPEGAAGAGSEAGLTGEPALGADGVPGDGLAAAGEAGATEAAGAPGMFPATGAGGLGRAEQGQGREYWATEDEATWGPEVMPGEIAGAQGAAADSGLGLIMPGGSGARRRQQRDRGKLAWLGEDEDFWGAGGPATPPVIGG